MDALSWVGIALILGFGYGVLQSIHRIRERTEAKKTLREAGRLTYQHSGDIPTVREDQSPSMTHHGNAQANIPEHKIAHALQILRGSNSIFDKVIDAISIRLGMKIERGVIEAGTRLGESMTEGQRAANDYHRAGREEEVTDAEIDRDVAELNAEKEEATTRAWRAEQERPRPKKRAGKTSASQSQQAAASKKPGQTKMGRNVP